MSAGLLACLVLVAAVSGAVAAGTTAVSVAPGQATADVGETVTVDVVVETANGGVGAWEATVNLTDGGVAAIVDVRLYGNPGLQTVDIAADNDSVYFDGALADTDDTGAVTIATLEIEVTGTGETGLALAVDALGDESGNSYTVSETYDGILGTDGTSAEGTDTGGETDNTDGSTEGQTSTAPDDDTATDSSNSVVGSTETDHPTTNAESESADTAETETSTTDQTSETATTSENATTSATERTSPSNTFAPGFSIVTALLAIGLAAFVLRRR